MEQLAHTSSYEMEDMINKSVCTRSEMAVSFFEAYLVEYSCQRGMLLAPE